MHIHSVCLTVVTGITHVSGLYDPNHTRYDKEDLSVTFPWDTHDLSAVLDQTSPGTSNIGHTSDEQPHWKPKTVMMQGLSSLVAPCCRYDNHWWQQWRQSWHHDDSRYKFRIQEKQWHIFFVKSCGESTWINRYQKLLRSKWIPITHLFTSQRFYIIHSRPVTLLGMNQKKNNN